MNLAAFTLGPYTVRLRQEPGIQCALYHVYLGALKIGQCISVPSVSDCDWLERVQREQTFYAYSVAPHAWSQRNASRRERTGGIGPALARWEGHAARKRGR